jgi:hypothetical protein
MFFLSSMSVWAAARLVYGLRPVYSRWRGWFMEFMPLARPV